MEKNKNNPILLSAVILTKNEELRIASCLESLSFCDEIIVIDNGSTDKTIEIAKRFHAKIHSVKESDFSELRNVGKEKAEGEWILYIDADEVVTERLKKEIIMTISGKKLDNKQKTINNSDHCLLFTDHKYKSYYIKRRNFYLGHEWPVQDKMQRLFLKSNLILWTGIVHETAQIKGSIDTLREPLIHSTHRTLEEMVEKTNIWSHYEAQLRFTSHHPKVVWWRLLRVMVTGFFRSFIKEGGWRAGTVGWIESIYQGFSMFITYAKLWEMQVKDVRDKI